MYIKFIFSFLLGLPAGIGYKYTTKKVKVLTNLLIKENT